MIRKPLRFYSPDERMPEKSCEVLVVTKGTHSLHSVGYSKLHNRFNCHDFTDDLQYSWPPEGVIAWAYMDKVVAKLMEVYGNE